MQRFDEDKMWAAKELAVSRQHGVIGSGTTLAQVLTDAPKESELARELRRMDQACHALEKALSMLSERLAPLSIPRPEAAGNACGTSGPCSQIGGRINNSTLAIESAERRLLEIMDSLAL
jgi:hypothetical protein